MIPTKHLFPFSYHGKVMATSVYFFSSDINECSYDINVCDENAKCVNRIGSYECFCETGYTGNGENCYGMNFKL
jgi:hypothetical protein